MQFERSQILGHLMSLLMVTPQRSLSVRRRPIFDQVQNMKEVVTVIQSGYRIPILVHFP